MASRAGGTHDAMATDRVAAPDSCPITDIAKPKTAVEHPRHG